MATYDVLPFEGSAPMFTGGPLVKNVLSPESNIFPVYYFINKVWDTDEEDFVRWTTVDAPDTDGSEYPGPGTWGVDTSYYRVEMVYT